MALYQILDGVHRSVAARMAGLTEIRAVVDSGGVHGVEQMLNLNNLYSPKAAIGRWDRGRDFQDLVAIMTDASKRAAEKPIIVANLPASAKKYFTPVTNVAVI